MIRQPRPHRKPALASTWARNRVLPSSNPTLSLAREIRHFNGASELLHRPVGGRVMVMVRVRARVMLRVMVRVMVRVRVRFRFRVRGRGRVSRKKETLY
jgi:hypothetical protein